MGALGPTEFEAIAVVKEMTVGSILPRCLYTVAEFAVADAIGDDEVGADEIARRSGLDVGATSRVLRLLAAHGVFERTGDRFSHTAASRLLRSDHPFSLRAHVRNNGTALSMRLNAELPNAVRAGGPTVGFAELEAHFSEHPDAAATFDAAMVSNAATIIPAVLDAVDLGQCHVVADIGGGRGHVLSAILDRHPGPHGVLFDLPHVIAQCQGLSSPRLELVGGDFFASDLPSADVYVLMSVLHDWTDADAARLLANLRRAAAPGARLLVIETVLSDEPGPDYAKTLDVLMLAVTGGRERTAAEYVRLLAASAFDVSKVVRTPAAYSVVEAIAV